MSRVAGVRKVVLLTLWLLMPLAIVALLMWFIFASFQAGPAMDARAVGQGARDTGGANAIGEMLAGNDPDARQAEQRSLRAGERVDPRTWPAGVRLLIELPPEFAEPPPGASYELVLGPGRRLVGVVGEGVLVVNALPGALGDAERIEVVRIASGERRVIGTVRLPDTLEAPSDRSSPLQPVLMLEAD
ncbi:MAG: hypothetical protein AAF995_06105 [Planctomycetota bacterium]